MIKRFLPLVILSTLHGQDLGMIQVESSKLEESILDLSSSVSKIDSEELSTHMSDDFKELSSAISNSNISGIGNRYNQTFSIRGINNYVGYESSVAMYIDDMPIPFSYGYDSIDFNNISSIEILKGAQGTQFGKGAQSAVINIYTKPFTNEFKGEAKLSYGSYNSKELYTKVSGPTSNKDLKYLFAFTKKTTDGFSTNKVTDANFDHSDYGSFYAKLNYNPDNPFDITLNYSNTKADDGGTAFKIDTKEDIRNIYGEISNDTTKVDTDSLSLNIKYKQDDYKITSITSYAHQSVKEKNYMDLSGGLDLNFDIDLKEVSQELRVKYDFDMTDLLAGVFYSNKYSFDYDVEQYLLARGNLASLSYIENPDENMALFTQLKHYFLDNYAITAGVRYQKTKREFTRQMNDFAQPTTNVDASTTWNHTLPTLSLSYFGYDNSLSYLTYSKGYRPGGYNYRSSTISTFDPEFTDSFELGYKKVDTKELSYSAVLFYNDIKNNRVNIFNPDLTTKAVSANKAYSYGIEANINHKTQDFDTVVSLGAIKAKFDDFIYDSKDYSGQNIIDTPNFTASVASKYKMTQNHYAKGALKHIGSRYYNIQNSAKESSYTTFDIAFGYDKKDDFSIELYGKNIFDKEYVDFMIDTSTNKYYHFGNPRVIGITLNKKF